MDEIDSEQLEASAARFLIDGGDEDAASLMLACRINVYPSGDGWWQGDEYHHALHIEVHCPRAAYDVLMDESNATGKLMRDSLAAVRPSQTYLRHFTVHGKLIEIDPDWRTELLEIARRRGVHNQAAGAENARTWRNLRFRSQSEIRIAEALEEAGVMFLPNCFARLGPATARRNREADFLVCHNGKWGILEVDGEPFHPPSRTVFDHERDRLFKGHGVRVAEHYDATRCYEEPHKVVLEFLKILGLS